MEHQSVPEQAAVLTTVILSARARLSVINQRQDVLATEKANTITELNGALKALQGLVGGL